MKEPMKQFSIKIPHEVETVIQQYAKEKGVNLSSAVRMVLFDYVNGHNRHQQIVNMAIEQTQGIAEKWARYEEAKKIISKEESLDYTKAIKMLAKELGV